MAAAGTGGGDLAKATITDDTGLEVTCLFRPKEYTFTKQNQWSVGKTKGKNVGQLEFGGGNPATLQMELFFDTYEAGGDVRELYTNKLWKMMRVNKAKVNPKTKKSEPPEVVFRWGATWSFKAVISQMTQKYTLFLPNGTPVRATVQVTFTQKEDEGEKPFQNPTSQALAGHKIRVVREGDVLDHIAYEEYGNSTLWRKIADANNLENPLKLKPGQALLVPPL